MNTFSFFLRINFHGFYRKKSETQWLDNIQGFPSPKDFTTIMTAILDRTESEENRDEVETIMKYIDEKNDLVFGEDIIVSESFKNYSTFSNFLNDNKNKAYLELYFAMII
jgi:hypothetical protein